MKRIVLTLILLSAAFTAIAQEKPYRERSVFSEVLSFTEYEDLFISTGDYHGKYKTLGLLNIKIFPEESGRMGHIKPEVIEEKELLEMAVTEARKIGADGILFYQTELTVSASFDAGYLGVSASGKGDDYLSRQQERIRSKPGTFYTLFIRALLIKRE